MDNYFSSEIKQIEKELTQLKTSMAKSAGVIQTVATSLSVEVPLALNPARTTATGTKVYRVRPVKDAIIVCSLDWYCENPLVDYKPSREVRKIYLVENESGGDRLVNVNAMGTEFGDNSDVQKLINGQSVSISATLTIRATCEFTVEAVDE